MPRRSFRGSRRSGARRKLVWARLHDSLTFGYGAAGVDDVAPARIDALTLFEQSLGASVVGTTVARVRGYMAFGDSDKDAGEEIQCRATCYVGSDNEVARGPAGSDNAFGQLAQNKDFFLFEPFIHLADGAIVNSGGTDPAARMIDVKASRKIEELNQTIILDVSGFSSNSVAGGNSALRFDLSFLLMLP